MTRNNKGSSTVRENSARFATSRSLLRALLRHILICLEVAVSEHWSLSALWFFALQSSPCMLSG